MNKKIVKTFPLTKDESGWITVNTSAVDRDKDRVLPSGVLLDNYLKHPILIFGHNYSEPWAVVGRAEDINAADESIKILPDLRAPVNESDPMHIIQALWDAQLLASSIGFNPEEWTENEFGGLDYTRWELLEVSLVPVPANQEALRLTVKALGDKPEGVKVIQATCKECGRVSDYSATLFAEILAGNMPLLCEECLAKDRDARQIVAGSGIVTLDGNVTLSSIDTTLLTPERLAELLDAPVTVTGDSSSPDEGGTEVDVFEQIREMLSEHDSLSPEAAYMLAIMREAGRFAIKAVVPYSAHGDVPAAPEDQEWSGADARKRLQEWAGGDEWDATKYRQGFAFVDGDPLLLGSYKGPHHDIVDGDFSTVWAGVRSAMAALVYDARGGMIADEDDRRGVFLHLEKHYEQWNKEPPSFKSIELYHEVLAELAVREAVTVNTES